MNPVTVQQIVDVDTWSIEITLDPGPIIEALAAQLTPAQIGNLVALHHLEPGAPETDLYTAALERAWADTFTVTLTPSQAEAFGGDLYEATTLPEQCHYCESFSVVTVEGDELCHAHARAHDQASSLSILHHVAAGIEWASIRAHDAALAGRTESGTR